MADKSKPGQGSDGNYITEMYRDVGGGTHAQAVYVENPLSSKTSVTTLTNTVLDTLLTAINSYLVGSSKKLYSVQIFGAGIASIAYFAVIVEVTG